MPVQQSWKLPYSHDLLAFSPKLQPFDILRPGLIQASFRNHQADENGRRHAWWQESTINDASDGASYCTTSDSRMTPPCALGPATFLQQHQHH